MYRRYTRTMNERERAKLREFSELADALSLLDLLWRAVFVGMALAVILLPVWAKGGSGWIYLPVILGAVAILGVSIYQYFQGQWAQAELEEREREILASPQVEIEQFQCRRAIELDTGRGEGAMFVVELGDGRVAFLYGQMLNHTDDDLPSTEFELVLTKTADVWLGIFNTGEKLDAPLVRAPRDFPPADFDELVFVTGTLEDDLTELCRRAVESPLPPP